MTLGTGATACIHLLPPLLQHLRQQHPLLTVGVTTGGTRWISSARWKKTGSISGLVLAARAGAQSGGDAAMLDEEFVTIYASRETEMPAVYTPAELQAQPLGCLRGG